MKTKNKLVLLVSDTHIGSVVGLWPSKFVSNEGFPIGQNQFQRWLWSKWGEFLHWKKRIINGCHYDVVLNGDIVEGIHHRTLQVMSPDIGDQVSASIMVLKELIEGCDNLYIIKGTECHTRNDEIHLGGVLKSVIDPSTGQRAFDNLDLEVNGVLYNFAHHISASSKSAHEAGEHSRNLCDITHCRARVGKPVPKVVCRAHRHRHGVWSDGNQMSVTTGAWQGLTRHGHKVVPNAVPQPSAIIFDSRDLLKGELPIVHQKIFTAK